MKLLLLSVLLATLSLASTNSCSSDSLSTPLAAPACRAITLIFVRGSTEPGTIGIIVGPGLSCGLKRRFGARNVRTQGVTYPAKIEGNYEPEGCHAEGIAQTVTDIQEAVIRCPETKVVVGGYSQGAACVHAAFRRLDVTTLDKVVGAVTFGDTRNQQDGGRVPNYPPERTRIFCANGDEVCTGVLKTSNVHRSYYRDTPAAVSFLAKRIGAI